MIDHVETALKIATDLRKAERRVDRDPSDAQKASGVYAKGHLKAHGLDITVENPKGSERSGVGRDGKRWSVKMPATYGYVKGSEGADGDHVDVYLGPDHASQKVFVVDQIDAETGKYDEHKCMLSYGSKADAIADYKKAFSDGKGQDRIGAVTEMTVPEFRDWLKSGNTKKPLGLRKSYAAGGAVMPIMNLNSQRNAVDKALTAARKAKKRAKGGRVGYYDGGEVDNVIDGLAFKTARREQRASARKAMAGRDPELNDMERAAIAERMPAFEETGRGSERFAADMLGAQVIPAAYDTYKDPSIANATNLGVRAAQAAWKPGLAIKAFGAGLGASVAKDAGLLDAFVSPADAQQKKAGKAPFPEAPADLPPAMALRWQDLTARLQKDQWLPAAERKELEGYNEIVKQTMLGRSNAAAQGKAARDAAEAEIEKEKGLAGITATAAAKKSAQDEYDRAIQKAEFVRDAELAARKSKKFSETEVGQLYDKVGVAAPGLIAAGLGGLSRAASGGGSALKNYGLPAAVGTGTGVAAANWPLAHELIFQPAGNPERNAYQAYARELPPTHPRKAEWLDYARNLREDNPDRAAASAEFYDPVKLAERSAVGGIEGILGGVAGAEAVRLPGRALDVVAGLPGRVTKSYTTSMADANADKVRALNVARDVQGLRQNAGRKDQLLDEAAALDAGATSGPLGSPSAVSAVRRETTAPMASPIRSPQTVHRGLQEDPVPLPGSSQSPASESSRPLVVKKTVAGYHYPAGHENAGQFVPHEVVHGAPKDNSKALPSGKGNAKGTKTLQLEAPKSSSKKSAIVDERMANYDKLQSGKIDQKTFGELERDALRRQEKDIEALAEKNLTDPGRNTTGMMTGGAVDRALAVAGRYSTGGHAHYEHGGSVHTGAVVGSTGGEADNVNMQVPSGAYVIPAYAVSGWPGAGHNSEAGMAALSKIFGPPMKMAAAAGGAVPIKISHGEFVVSPAQVKKIGHGDLQMGHRTLDALMKKIKADNIAQLKTKPDPAV